MAFQQKIADEGGPCKGKENFCLSCEPSSGEHDLLSFVSGKEVCCDMCVRNGHETCANLRVNDELELQRQGEVLLSLLRDDFSRREGVVNATYKDLIPDEEVECFASYDDDAARLNEQVNLIECMSDDGMTLTRDHLLDYVRNILHSEETQAIILESSIKYDP